MKKTASIEISFQTIAFSIGLLIFLILAWKIRAILLALGVSIILMSGFAPLIDYLVSKKINKTLSVITTFILAISLLGLVLFVIVPPLIKQISLFISDLPTYLLKLSNYSSSLGLPSFTNDSLFQLASAQASAALSNLLSLFFNAFNGFLTFISIAVFSFYLLLERDRIKKSIFVFFPGLPREETLKITHQIEKQLGAWVRGELILMFLVGMATWIGLSLLRVQFALPLAVIAGLLEAIAVIGPFLSAVPAVIIVIASGASPLVIIGIVALYILIQQVENYLLVPSLMREVVGLSPLITIISILIGGSLFGVAGAAIAVPAAAAAQVLMIYIRDSRQKDYAANKVENGSTLLTKN